MCCGGGAANFFTDLIGTAREKSPARLKVREAYEIGADIVATACPTCSTLLETAIKDESLEGKLTVKSIAELVEEASSP